MDDSELLRLFETIDRMCVEAIERAHTERAALDPRLAYALGEMTAVIRTAKSRHQHGANIVPGAMHIILGEREFRALVNGAVAAVDGYKARDQHNVQIILSDIGFVVMEHAIAVAKEAARLRRAGR